MRSAIAKLIWAMQLRAHRQQASDPARELEPEVRLTAPQERPDGLYYSERRLWDQSPLARDVIARLARCREANRRRKVAAEQSGELIDRLTEALRLTHTRPCPTKLMRDTCPACDALEALDA